MSSHESVTVTTVNSLSALQTTAVKGDVVQLKNSNGNYYHSIILSYLSYLYVMEVFFPHVFQFLNEENKDEM